MNFLAHTLLAGADEADRIGGLLGDFIKGPLPAGLPPALASGVALHRAIDGYADRHPAFLASRARVSSRRRRVAGVLVDLFYDHLLARDWPGEPASRTEPSGTATETGDARPPLAVYTAAIYAALPAYLHALPAPARAVAERMCREDWLTHYRNPAAVARAIDQMSIHRLKRANPLAGGFEEFLADPDGFAADFRAFLPDALAFAAQWRERRSKAS